jgi:hypothetical protein
MAAALTAEHVAYQDLTLSPFLVPLTARRHPLLGNRYLSFG